MSSAKSINELLLSMIPRLHGGEGHMFFEHGDVGDQALLSQIEEASNQSVSSIAKLVQTIEVLRAAAVDSGALTESSRLETLNGLAFLRGRAADQAGLLRRDPAAAAFAIAVQAGGRVADAAAAPPGRRRGGGPRKH